MDNFTITYTVGPSSLEQPKACLEAGATGARLTFSFGTPALQHERALSLKAAAAALGRSCEVIADLAGGKFRLGTFRGAPTVAVAPGVLVRLHHAEEADPTPGDLVLPVPDIAFFRQLRRGARVTVGDSLVLEITTSTDDAAQAEVVAGSVVNQRRGLVVAGADFCPAALTPKDRQDLDHILSADVYDAVAVSFVSSADDIVEVRHQMERHGRRLPIVAKIETQRGLENRVAICQVADQVMAARGDLAQAVSEVKLHAAVTAIAATTRACGIPWILATKIAEGLQPNGELSDPEKEDLAHWLGEGCAGVLLSYETAFGAYPIEALAAVAKEVTRRGSL